MPRPALSTDDVPSRDRLVRIVVLLVQNDKTESVKVTGPVRAAVRAAFAHPRLTAALQTLQMDADRLVNRIVSRWEHHDEPHQQWEKSNGSMTVRWWIDRDDGRAVA
jgi:DNA primase